MTVRKLNEEDDIGVCGRILLRIYCLNDVNNTGHPGDFVEDDLAAGNRQQQNWLYACHLVDLPFRLSC